MGIFLLETDCLSVHAPPGSRYFMKQVGKIRGLYFVKCTKLWQCRILKTTLKLRQGQKYRKFFNYQQFQIQNKFQKLNGNMHVCTCIRSFKLNKAKWSIVFYYMDIFWMQYYKLISIYIGLKNLFFREKVRGVKHSPSRLVVWLLQWIFCKVDHLHTRKINSQWLVKTGTIRIRRNWFSKTYTNIVCLGKTQFKHKYESAFIKQFEVILQQKVHGTSM